MNVKEQVVSTKSLLTKSNLPASDYVINPYIGCPHACKYCYARFMKRFTKHKEAWGTFLDIKHCDQAINAKTLHHKTVFLSSVTDCYNPYEAKYKLTRSILEQLKDVDCFITISTKSDLILRDLDILKQLKHVVVAISINTLDESFKHDMDQASSIANRLSTLKTLYENGIHAVLFMSPIFPYITDVFTILNKTSTYVCEYWFENLNLRGEYKQTMLTYIAKQYPHLIEAYDRIYNQKDRTYWIQLSKDIESYCQTKQLAYTNYFYHDVLVANKKANKHQNR